MCNSPIAAPTFWDSVIFYGAVVGMIGILVLLVEGARVPWASIKERIKRGW